jgi:electron transfer flavoprotein alpha subunit
MSCILVIADHDGGKLKDAGLELVSMAKAVGEASGLSVVGAVLGAEPQAAAADFAERGGLPVVAAADPLLADYSSDAWTAAVAKLVEAKGASLVLTTHDARGWDWAARVALRCDGAPASECTGIAWEDGGFVYTRKAFNAKLDMRFKLNGSPAVATVQRGAAAAWEGGGESSVEDWAPGLTEGDVRGRNAGVKASEGGKVDLTQEDVIVAGGRSLGGPEKFELLEELATALGGAVGASRPVTDAGWLTPERQVGSSGVTVSPKLYIACGISGAIQHVVGMKGSDFIVAINKDARAPIFDVADVGVVGDLFEIVPALTAAVKEAKG